jgi:hypothetical protein
MVARPRIDLLFSKTFITKSLCKSKPKNADEC